MVHSWQRFAMGSGVMAASSLPLGVLVACRCGIWKIRLCCPFARVNALIEPARTARTNIIRLGADPKDVSIIRAQSWARLGMWRVVGPWPVPATLFILLCHIAGLASTMLVVSSVRQWYRLVISLPGRDASKKESLRDERYVVLLGENLD
jgi:hypothetical protein